MVRVRKRMGPPLMAGASDTMERKAPTRVGGHPLTELRPQVDSSTHQSRSPGADAAKRSLRFALLVRVLDHLDELGLMRLDALAADLRADLCELGKLADRDLAGRRAIERRD